MARGRMVYVPAKKKNTASQVGHWSEKKKYEAVCLWSSGVSMRQVSIDLGIPYDTLARWRSSDWWRDIHKDIQSEDKQQLDARLSKILDKTLDSMMDRIENGEFVYDQKTGSLKRSPAKLRDVTTAMNTVLDKRNLIRKEPTKIVEQTSTQTQLQNLADQFAKFVNANTLKREDVDIHSLVQQEDGTYGPEEENSSEGAS